jgi:hypothetical protein
MSYVSVATRRSTRTAVDDQRAGAHRLRGNSRQVAIDPLAREATPQRSRIPAVGGRPRLFTKSDPRTLVGLTIAPTSWPHRCWVHATPGSDVCPLQRRCRQHHREGGCRSHGPGGGASVLRSSEARSSGLVGAPHIEITFSVPLECTDSAEAVLAPHRLSARRPRDPGVIWQWQTSTSICSARTYCRLARGVVRRRRQRVVGPVHGWALGCVADVVGSDFCARYVLGWQVREGWPARSFTPGRGRRSRPSTIPPASAQTALSLASRLSVSVGG